MSPRTYPVSVNGPAAAATGVAPALGAAAAAALLCSKRPPPVSPEPASTAGGWPGASDDGAAGGAPASPSARAARAPAQQISKARQAEVLIVTFTLGSNPRTRSTRPSPSPS